MALRDQPDQVLPSGYTRRRCSNCRRVRPCRFRENPFLADVHNDKTRAWLCDECVQMLAEEI